MNEKLVNVSGKFEGYFYTLQKMPMGQLEKLPGGQTHEVYIYRGDLTNVQSIAQYSPEEHLNREGLLLHNVSNVQIGNPEDKNRRVYDFDQIVLKDVEVEQSWELNGKTYGILKGHLIGKIKQPAAGTDFSANFIPPPAPPPVEKKWWDSFSPNTGIFEPPVTGGGGTGQRGCFSWIWNIIKWLLLILLIVFIYNACFKNDANNDCSELIEEIQKQNDSLIHRIDSLNGQLEIKDSVLIANEESRIQEEINSISERIYFFGNSDEIREYSENSLKDLIDILKKYPQINLEIQGHMNGSDPDYLDLDLRRAEKVKNLLIEKGVDSKRLTTVGMGDNYPVVDKNIRSKDPWGNEYNSNMRVEIIIRK